MTLQRLSEKPSKSETVSDGVSRGDLAFLTKTPASEHKEAGWKISEGSGWRCSLPDRERRTDPGPTGRSWDTHSGGRTRWGTTRKSTRAWAWVSSNWRGCWWIGACQTVSRKKSGSRGPWRKSGSSWTMSSWSHTRFSDLMLPITSAKPIPERNPEGNGGEPGGAAACQGIGHDGHRAAYQHVEAEKKGPEVVCTDRKKNHSICLKPINSLTMHTTSGGELSKWWIAAAGVPNSNRVDVFLYWIHFQRDCADQKREEITCPRRLRARWLTAARSFLWRWGLQLHTPHFWWGPHGHLRLHHRHLGDEDGQGSSSGVWDHHHGDIKSNQIKFFIFLFIAVKTYCRSYIGLPQDAVATVQGDDQDLLQPHRQLTLWKKVNIFPAPSRDVTDQPLSGRE